MGEGTQQRHDLQNRIATIFAGAHVKSNDAEAKSAHEPVEAREKAADVSVLRPAMWLVHYSGPPVAVSAATDRLP